MIPTRLFAAILCLASLFSELQAAQNFGVSLSNPGVIKIEVESILNDIPIHGHYPLRITLENHSGQERTWNLDLVLNSGYNERHTHKATLTVPDGRTQSFDYLLPIATNQSGGYSSGHLQGMLRGPGIVDGEAQFYESASWSNPANTTHIGVLASLFDRVGLNENKGGSSSSGTQQARTRIDPAKLPSDPRALTGLDVLWMDATEWLSISPALRLTLLDWVALGGNLQLIDNLPKGPDQALRQSMPAPLRSPSISSSSLPMSYGFGQIQRRAPKPDREMKTSIETISSPKYSLVPSQPMGLSEADAWASSEGITAIRLGGVIIISFLIIFTIIAGPVNLFVFARGSKRWRLFITTPLISLVGSGLLILLMFVQDGLGGDGVRSRVALLLPESGRIALRQISTAKTGLLSGSGFTSNDQPSLWREDQDARRGNGLSFSTDDRGNYSGDFFASRSRLFHQGFSLISNSGRIVQQPDEGGKPTLLSTVDAVLAPIFLVDSDGKVWKGGQLALGGKAILSESTEEEIGRFLNDFQQGKPDFRLLDRLKGTRNIIVARADNLRNDSLDFHPGVRWKKTDTVLVTTPAAP